MWGSLVMETSEVTLGPCPVTSGPSSRDLWALVPSPEAPLPEPSPCPQVAVRACFLGVTFGCGLVISFSDTSWTHFGW
ncbi:Protein-S-isoprenylcysteine O-methyltransferase [Liparis tanakae]|uniref:Protein-S-isoprenylcysteine O-methyltransferase n=1 Tax=Liparis tanakae TaxID=230148 RepID=A0A4Z2E3T8_9TELE|nr:Protein-S-isoprenylcysteine O-methyltransferase [Liparis tanakae]